jgi:hypothetical protein
VQDVGPTDRRRLLHPCRGDVGQGHVQPRPKEAGGRHGLPARLPGNRLPFTPCFGCVPFWYGSGYADPCLGPMDPDPDPAIFVLDLQDANKKIIFFFSKFFPAYHYFLKVHLHHFLKIKSHKVFMISGHKTVAIKVFLTIFVS